MEWTLYSDGELPGPYNMAKDDRCLDLAIEGQRPVLRLYGWRRMTLSLGRTQKLDRQIDQRAVAEMGIPMIRRQTGGRAVLHGGDLTYSICAPNVLTQFEGGVMGAYRTIADVFAAFFRRLGYEPQIQSYAGRERAVMASANCFATPSAFEILIDGKKLVGSAQRRRARGFLQHGSIPLAPQHEMLAKIYSGSSQTAIQSQMTDLDSMGVWRTHTALEIRELLVDTFADSLGVSFTGGSWSPRDEAQVQSNLAQYPLIWAEAEPPPGEETAPDGKGMHRAAT